jgi:hypothetical protein
MIQYSVAVLEKDQAISCGLRLVLNHLACSESFNNTLLGHIASKVQLLGPAQSAVDAVGNCFESRAQVTLE